MISSWPEFAAALESPQGTTIYALLVMALLSAASFWLQNRARPGKLAPSLISTLTILTVLRLLEALVGAAAWFGDPVALRMLPALERGLHLITIFALAWLWLQAHNAPRVRVVFSIGLFVILAMTGLLFALWLGNPAQATFNYTDLDYVWTATCIVALLFAVYEMLRTRQTTGLLLFAFLFVGQVLHFMLAEPFGSMPLAAQAAHLIGLPLLFMLPVTQASAEDQAATPAPTTTESEAAAQEEPEFFDFEADQPVAESSLDDLARHTAARMGADICVFANRDEATGKLKLIAGYNLLRGPIEPESIPLNQLPELHAALATGEPMSVSAEERSPELNALSQALRLSFQAYLLAAPLAGSPALPQPAVLLLSLEHSWQKEDENNLTALSEDLASQLHSRLGNEYTPTPISTPQPAREIFDLEPAPVTPEWEAPIFHEQEAPLPIWDEIPDPQTRLEQLEAENESYRQDVERLLAHIDELEAQPGATNGQAMQSHELVQALQMENERMKSSLASLDEAPKAAPATAVTIDVAQAKEELRLAMEEVARLHGELEEAQRIVLAAEVAGPAAPKMASSQMEVIASVAQELRQPLSSIVGYTDLLLGESVGILGALQRKFLERVRSSTGRMNTLIDNLIRIAELDQAGYSANRMPVQLSSVIDDAIGLLRQQFQEKRIAMRVDLPETLPELNTDRDALQQILYHLLQNADAATPAEGSISLRAVVDNQKELGEFVLIQVSDSGGGIPESDLPRVFSRVYRASNPVIPGVGDTGVGLTIAETLTQALGGRIWVESEAGVGATFSVLLPLNQT